MLVGYLGLGYVRELGYPLALLLGLFVLSLLLPLILRIRGIGYVQLLKLLNLLLHRRLEKVDSHMRHGCRIKSTWIWVIGIISQG